jgi:ABC-2 type transport system ATP-binding protein
MGVIVTFESVEKHYGRVAALGGIDLNIPQGSITGLIGPNGAGKTTSMLIMSTLLDRDAGRVRVGDLDPQTDARGVRRILGYMPDFFGFYDSLTSKEYLDFFAATQGIKPAKRPGIIADLLALVDLESKVDEDVNALSRGMKQRLSLARALLHDPDLLVLDEPASGLDPRARVHLRELIAELSRLGKTIVISSHILSELEGICTNMAIIDSGRVKAHGSIDDIRRMIVAARRISVRTPDEHVDEVADVLAEDDRVSDVVVERGLVRFTLAGADDESATLLSTLVGTGTPIIEWRIESAGLEELFMQLTEETT